MHATNGRCAPPAKPRPLRKYAPWSNPILCGTRAEDGVLRCWRNTELSSVWQPPLTPEQDVCWEKGCQDVAGDRVHPLAARRPRLDSRRFWSRGKMTGREA